MTAAELQVALDNAANMTGDAKGFHQDIQSRALVSIVALLEAGAISKPATGAVAKANVAATVELRRVALDALAPFKRAMAANAAGGKMLKPEMVVMQIGSVSITGEDVKNAADAYDELWAGR